jgi:molybdopterin/thiamine biosynthesis adenylyltransferase
VLDNLRLSRALSAAANLGVHAPDHHRFVDKRVLLTGEPDTLATANGRECLLSSLRLLIRICPRLTVSLPPGARPLAQECQTLADRIAFGGGVDCISGVADFSKYDAILSVGTRANPVMPWTVINSEGWLARVSSGSSNLHAAVDRANPVAALAAACLGVAEVFKRLIRLKETRGRLVDGLTFSLYSYRCGDADPGPTLPVELALELLLVGVGAIGNGIVHLLAALPTSGQVCVVDRQDFEEENLGTCLLIGPQDLGAAKATFAQTVLCKRLTVKAFHEDLEAFEHRLGAEINYPPIVLTALDNIATRHAAQKLWPDLIIDGAIGDFPCQVSRHRWGEDSACLVCLFRHPPGPAAEAMASRATGLMRLRLQSMDDQVTTQDIEAAPLQKREWLRPRLGRQICAVVGEGVTQMISEEEQRRAFAPSVPFVACMSACMVIAELVKSVAGWRTALDTRYQFDMLSGPTLGSMFPQEKRQDCDCVFRGC